MATEYTNEEKDDNFNEEFGKPQPIETSTSPLDRNTRRQTVLRVSYSQTGSADDTVIVNVGDDLQAALDQLRDIGGGSLQLFPGRYISTTPIRGYPNVSINGQSPSTTIIDFNNTSSNLSYSGTQVYNTGTITSISGGVSVTGSGTSWLANVAAGQYLFIGTRHYLIAAVTSDTTLVLAEGYTDSVTLPATYRITTAIADISLKNFRVTNSTGTGVVIDDGLQMTIDNVQALTCNKGFAFSNCSRMNIDRTLGVGNTSNGYEFTNVGQSDWESMNATSNGGHGFVFNNVKTLSGLLSSVANTSDGYNCTDLKEATLLVEASGNGGQGVEFVSGCDKNSIDGIVTGNTSDGVKLTATSDDNTLRGIITDNGGYGINIAAASCNSNVLAVPHLHNNSSGDYNDSGTDTNIVLTSGVNDVQFTAGDSLAPNQSVFLATSGTSDLSLVSISTGSGEDNIGDTTSTEKVAQSISLSTTSTVNKVTARLRKEGSPSDNVTVSIQADSAGSPSGTPLASATVAASSIGSSMGTITFTFSTPVTLTASTTYWVVIARSGSVNATDYYRINTDNANPYGSGVAKVYDDGVWVTLNSVNHDLRIAVLKSFTAGLIYLTSAVQSSTTKVLGLSKGTYAAGSMATIQFAGVKESMSGLTIGSTYYLSDTEGALSTSAGSVSKVVGRGLSATQLQILYDIN